MDNFTPEQWNTILIIVSGAIGIMGAAMRYWTSRQNAKIRVAESRAEEAKTEAQNTTALIEVLGRQQGTLEKILQRSIDAEERQREQIETFTQTVAANAAAKTGLTDAVTETNTRLNTMATSLDENTDVLKVNTQTVGTHTERVGSVEQRLTTFEENIRNELQAVVAAVRNGLSDERMTPLIEKVVQTAIERVKEPAPAPHIVEKADEDSEEKLA